MDYAKAFERAILYIEAHLSEEIRMKDVAHAAGYSYYHLTRQFSALLGESLGHYVKKRRLANGAKQLIYSDARVIDIALSCGFESAEAFSRAFRSIFKMSPSAYRKQRLDLLIGAKPELDVNLLHHRLNQMTVHPVIVEMAPVKVVGIRGKTTIEDNQVRKLWDRFCVKMDQMAARGGFLNAAESGRSFGICEAVSEGNSLYTMNRKVHFSEVVGIEVKDFEGLGDDWVKKTLPGGRYAVFTHRGSLDGLMETYAYIWGTWFLGTDEVLDCREDFELYDGRFLEYTHPENAVDIYIPIV